MSKSPPTRKPGRQIELRLPPPAKKARRLELPLPKKEAPQPVEVKTNRVACHQLWLETTVESSRVISMLTTLCGSELSEDDIERVGATTLPVLSLFRQAAKRLVAASLQTSHGRNLIKPESSGLLINACLRCLSFKSGLLADATGLCEAAEKAGEAESLRLLQRARELARVGFIDYLSHVVREYPAITGNPEFVARQDWLNLLKTAKAN